MMAGENNGEVWEWHTRTGWKIVPGSETAGPNGLEISKDAKTLFIGAWAASRLFACPWARHLRRKTPSALDSAWTTLGWAPDGTLLAAGQGGTAPSQASYVARVDPNTLNAQELVRHPYSEAFTAGTVAIQIGKEVWVGSVRGDRIAILPAQPSR